jgi:hypothetical protein
MVTFDQLLPLGQCSNVQGVMRRLPGGLLIAVGMAGSPAVVWSLIASGYMDEHRHSGRKRSLSWDSTAEGRQGIDGRSWQGSDLAHDLLIWPMAKGPRVAVLPEEGGETPAMPVGA